MQTPDDAPASCSVEAKPVDVPTLELVDNTVATPLINQQLDELRTFFGCVEGAAQLAAFIQKPAVSGRLLDFLVTTYSQLHLCPVGDSDVRTIYEQALDRARGRANFDPFNRQAHGISVRARIGTTVLQTALAQLNFMRWFYVHRVDQFVSAHHENIAQSMKRTYKAVNAEKRLMARAGQKRKRKALIEKPCPALMISGEFAVNIM